jgi:hypothetical protein
MTLAVVGLCARACVWCGGGVCVRVCAVMSGCAGAGRKVQGRKIHQRGACILYYTYLYCILYCICIFGRRPPVTVAAAASAMAPYHVPPSGARHRLGGGGGAASIRGLHFERPGAGGGARDGPHETEPETHMWTPIVIADSSSSLRLRLRL